MNSRENTEVSTTYLARCQYKDYDIITKLSIRNVYVHVRESAKRTEGSVVFEWQHHDLLVT
jgi:hypothetical protein